MMKETRRIAIWKPPLQRDISPGPLLQLNVFPIEVPPLRERQDDVLMLLELFVHRFAQKMGKHFKKIDKRTVELLSDCG